MLPLSFALHLFVQCCYILMQPRLPARMDARPWGMQLAGMDVRDIPYAPVVSFTDSPASLVPDWLSSSSASPSGADGPFSVTVAAYKLIGIAQSKRYRPHVVPWFHAAYIQFSQDCCRRQLVQIFLQPLYYYIE